MGKLFCKSGTMRKSEWCTNAVTTHHSPLTTHHSPLTTHGLLAVKLPSVAPVLSRMPTEPGPVMDVSTADASVVVIAPATRSNSSELPDSLNFNVPAPFDTTRPTATVEIVPPMFLKMAACNPVPVSRNWAK